MNQEPQTLIKKDIKKDIGTLDTIRQVLGLGGDAEKNVETQNNNNVIDVINKKFNKIGEQFAKLHTTLGTSGGEGHKGSSTEDNLLSNMNARLKESAQVTMMLIGDKMEATPNMTLGKVGESPLSIKDMIPGFNDLTNDDMATKVRGALKMGAAYAFARVMSDDETRDKMMEGIQSVPHLKEAMMVCAAIAFIIFLAHKRKQYNEESFTKEQMDELDKITDVYSKIEEFSDAKEFIEKFSKKIEKSYETIDPADIKKLAEAQQQINNLEKSIDKISYTTSEELDTYKVQFNTTKKQLNDTLDKAIEGSSKNDKVIAGSSKNKEVLQEIVNTIRTNNGSLLEKTGGLRGSFQKETGNIDPQKVETLILTKTLEVGIKTTRGEMVEISKTNKGSSKDKNSTNNDITQEEFSQKALELFDKSKELATKTGVDVKDAFKNEINKVFVEMTPMASDKLNPLLQRLILAPVAYNGNPQIMNDVLKGAYTSIAQDKTAAAQAIATLEKEPKKEYPSEKKVDVKPKSQKKQKSQILIKDHSNNKNKSQLNFNLDKSFRILKSQPFSRRTNYSEIKLQPLEIKNSGSNTPVNSFLDECNISPIGPLKEQQTNFFSSKNNSEMSAFSTIKKISSTDNNSKNSGISNTQNNSSKGKI